MLKFTSVLTDARKATVGQSYEAREMGGSGSRIAAWLRTRLEVATLSRNAIFAVVQAIVVTLCVMLAYRLVISDVGLARTGVWSLLLTASALARIGDISGTNALARFVAITMRPEDLSAEKVSRNASSAAETIHTVLLTSFGITAALAGVLWIIAPTILSSTLDPEFVPEAKGLVPFMVAVVVTSALAMGVTSAIDGTQRTDKRAMVMIVSALVFLAASYFLVPHFGILGFAIAQIIQQCAAIALGWAVLRGLVSDLGWMPTKWRRKSFRATTSYALKLNGIGVVALMFEPLAKFALNHSGGPALVAIYELSNRIVMQIRSLVVSAAQPLLPALSAKGNVHSDAFRATLTKATQFTVLAAVGVAAVSLAATPIVSVLVLGHLSPGFLLMSVALTVGWSLHLPCLGFYIGAQAIGTLRWNFLSHTVLALFVVFGVFALEPTLGVNGILLGIVSGLFTSFTIALVGNAYQMNARGVLVGTASWIGGGIVAIAALGVVAWSIFSVI